MDWSPLSLAESTAGAEYGENTVRVADLLAKLSLNVSKDSRPAVVWLYRPGDSDKGADLDSKLFQSEQVGIALRMFRCYRVNVANIRNSRIKAEYRDTPSFRFFDPAGKQLARIDSRKADSLSTFSNVVKRVWRKSFTTSLRTYQHDEKGILDRLDKLNGLKMVLEQEKSRLTEMPNPRKARRLALKEKEIEKVAEKISKDEKEINAGAKLRSSYLAARGDQVAARYGSSRKFTVLADLGSARTSGRPRGPFASWSLRDPGRATRGPGVVSPRRRP